MSREMGKRWENGPLSDQAVLCFLGFAGRASCSASSSSSPPNATLGPVKGQNSALASGGYPTGVILNDFGALASISAIESREWENGGNNGGAR